MGLGDEEVVVVGSIYEHVYIYTILDVSVEVPAD